jgi:hypothetical protein
MMGVFRTPSLSRPLPRRGGLHRPVRAGALTAAALTAFLLTGCGSPAAPGPVAGAGSAPNAEAASGTATPGSVSPSVTVRTLTGSSLKLPTGEPTVIYFFTASCGDCATGIKNVAAGVAKAAPGSTAVAVDLDPGEPTEVLNQFMSSVGNPPLSVVRDDGTLLKQFNVDALGMTVALNPSGKEVYRGVDPSPGQTAAALATARS